MFIAMEGIDGCGKTTLSKTLAKIKGFTWTREPTFSSEEADRLNLSIKDPIGREVEFLIDRIKHQSYLSEYQPLVCDRYIWSGLAYCKVFSPTYYPFLERLYAHSFFDKPDYYVLVDTPLDVCTSRCSRAQSTQQLQDIRNAFLETKYLISQYSTVIIEPSIKTPEETVELLWNKIQDIEGRKK